MTDSSVRLGIVGLGNNTRKRHVPGFLQIDGVRLTAVCNRSRESTERAAQEYQIPKTFARWEDLVSDDDLDAIMIGTWPYLHCPITLAALEQGKHVLTEARMACNLAEARSMAAAAQRHPQLVTQIVPSPFGLRAGQVVRELLDSGWLGQLRELLVMGANGDFADPTAPLHWRQSAQLSGVNMLTLGILHETLMRWVPDPVRVTATTAVFVGQRPSMDDHHQLVAVERPDSVHVLTELACGARGVYQLSGVVRHGPGFQIHLYGSDGTLVYDLSKDRLMGGRASDAELREIDVPPEKRGGWQVEADFIDAIRQRTQPALTDFATGVRYMEFTEAVQQSADQRLPVTLPLAQSAESGSR